MSVVFDGKEGKTYQTSFSNKSIDNLVFSPNSKNIFYTVSTSNKEEFIVVNGMEENVYLEVSNLVFSNNGEHYAYLGKDENKFYIIIDGKKSKPYNYISKPSFDPNNQTVAYGVLDGEELFSITEQLD